MSEDNQKTIIRKSLREKLATLTPEQRHIKSHAACSLLLASPEFQAAGVIMIYLSTPSEVDTAPIALKAWQQGKTILAPRVNWHQRRMLPVEIASLTSGLTISGPGIREPVSGNPSPLNLIDLVIVPGVGFTRSGHRIGRGMGFYDRFLAQDEFMGLNCGLAFEEQIVENLPVLDHDVPLGMLVTDRGVWRWSPDLIRT
ncbi:MAG: 5-formyltetrahydrofolate cyclo-ligase [Tepidisphaeraceae bacterium]|jgi:5-formyltetrahydrofolate cyclo-ligase